MPECVEVAIQIKEGTSSSLYFTLQIKDKDTQEIVPIDLSNCSVKFQVREQLDDNGTYLINKSITTDSDILVQGRITTPESGIFQVRINKEDTEILKLRKAYFYTIKLVTSMEELIVSSNDGDYTVFKVVPA